MALKLEQCGENWKVIYSENQNGEKVLWDICGDGEAFELPHDVAEIRKRAFAAGNCPHLKKVVLPATVRTVHRGAFDGFDNSLVILCACPEKPEGFFEGEYEEVIMEDNAPYYITHYGSWLCRSAVLRSRDAEGRLTWASGTGDSELALRPRVRWGCAELA